MLLWLEVQFHPDRLQGLVGGLQLFVDESAVVGDLGLLRQVIHKVCGAVVQELFQVR